MNRFTRISIGATAAGALMVAGAVPALANVESRGACTVSSTWEADAERELGFIELDFEVNSTVPGEDWKLVVRQNGKQIYSDTRPATRDFDDRLADVDWSLTARDKSGVKDRFEMTATNQVTNERCQTTIRV